MKGIVTRYEVRYRTAGLSGEFVPSLLWRCRDAAERNAKARCERELNISGYRVVKVVQTAELGDE